MSLALLHLEWTKVQKNARNDQFSKTEAGGPIVLPDRSILIGRIMGGNWEMPQFEYLNATF